MEDLGCGPVEPLNERDLGMFLHHEEARWGHKVERANEEGADYSSILDSLFVSENTSPYEIPSTLNSDTEDWFMLPVHKDLESKLLKAQVDWTIESRRPELDIETDGAETGMFLEEEWFKDVDKNRPSKVVKPKEDDGNLMYVHFPTGRMYASALKLLEVAGSNDYTLAFDKGICPMSLYLYYCRLSFYTQNSKSLKKNGKFNTQKDWKTVCQLAEKSARGGGNTLVDVRGMYVKHGKVMGGWP